MIINNEDIILQLQNYIKSWRREFFNDMIGDQSNERGDLQCLKKSIK